MKLDLGGEDVMQRWNIGQLAGVVLAIVFAAGIAAGPASAATRVSVFPPDDDPRFGGPGGVSVVGDHRVNDIAVGFNRKRDLFSVLDSKARIRTQECARLSNHKVRCEADPSDHDVYVNGAEGDDRIRIRRGVTSHTLLSGNEGDDVLRGGLHHDSMFDGTGDDRLTGRSGDDFIEGGSGNDIERGGRGGDSLGGNDPGVDRFLGGRGVDFLETADRTLDDVIDCGPGRRRAAFVDPIEVSRVVRCQKVHSVTFSRAAGD
jgi:Ca2+-binding RTX toxin-like protein